MKSKNLGFIILKFSRDVIIFCKVFENYISYCYCTWMKNITWYVLCEICTIVGLNCVDEQKVSFTWKILEPPSIKKLPFIWLHTPYTRAIIFLRKTYLKLHYCRYSLAIYLPSYKKRRFRIITPFTFGDNGKCLFYKYTK